MRLRTCHDVFMVQCELCEAIRIVNASYAANRLQHRNPIQGCSGATFSQEFECLMSVKAQYFEAITESCDGIQSCQVTREGSVVSCGHSSKTWSCCMEIYYTCEPSKWKYKKLPVLSWSGCRVQGSTNYKEFSVVENIIIYLVINPVTF